VIIRGHYKTGIKPLPSSVDAKSAVKGISEDLPPMSDVELMFDHLVSRVSELCPSAGRPTANSL
jgi:hypothetical protein